ncbi:MAG: hypothetical protein P8Y25_14565, partial [Chromatiaceae bacterium]
MLMPLLASSLIANGVSYLICPESLYHALARPFVRHEPTPGPKSRVGHAARDSKQTEAENRRTG